MSDETVPEPAPPVGPPPPHPEPPVGPSDSLRRRIPWVPLVALVLAVVLLGAGVVSLARGNTESRDAQQELTRARRERAAAIAVLRRARADLAAARAAVATFGVSAQAATTATARVVELEGALVDLLARLRAAGAAAQIDTYNNLVDELNRTSASLATAFTELELPLQDFSNALDLLPAARCSAPISPKLRWVRYGDEGLQCARLQVPLDYSYPSGQQIHVTVVRRPADDPDSLGPLVLNPGGPGMSGVSFLRDALVLLPPELLRRFDVIGFDPRGVGHSTAVDCADDLDPLFDPDLTAPDPADRDAAIDAVARIARACPARSGPVLEHVDTPSAARDIERLRVALGTEQISYIGFSYGTYLGATYADVYPDRVRAAVLDGAVSPFRASESDVAEEATSFLDALDAALDSCAAETTCPFFSGGDPQRAYDRLMLQLVRNPLDVDGHRVGRALAEIGVVGGLYFGEVGWPRLMDALARASRGDGRALLHLADSYTGRRPDGTYTDEIEAHYAVNCTDLHGRLRPGEARDRARALGDDPGRLEVVALAFELPCAFWPVGPHSVPSPFDATGSAPILVIGGAADPATPFEGAEALADLLDRGVLVRSEDSGHTSFARGNQCIDDLVVAYLVDLTVPADGTVCPAG